jgi:hypothetical protein
MLPRSFTDLQSFGHPAGRAYGVTQTRKAQTRDALDDFSLASRIGTDLKPRRDKLCELIGMESVLLC